MSNPEISREAEASVEKENIKHLYDQLLAVAELEYDDEEIRDGIKKYLESTGKNIMELNQTDKENIFTDLLQWGLDNVTE